MRRMIQALMVVLCASLPGGAGAQTLTELFFGAVERNAQGALSIYGISAVPSETASTLRFEGRSDQGNTGDFEFLASQLGGGFTISESFPLYLEGFIAYNRYNPDVLLRQAGGTSSFPLKWTTLSATGGIGWDFKLTDDLVLRPMAHVSLGQVQSDLSIVGAILANRLGIDASVLDAGGLTVGGFGGSLGLEYNKRWENDYEVDVTLRHTHLRLVPIAGDRQIAAAADAITTSLWTRLRVPTGLHLWERPIRVVGEFSASILPGEQGRALGTAWLLQTGLGMEIDFEKTWVPLITTTRIVARYTRGEVLDGFTIGLAASF